MMNAEADSYSDEPGLSDRKGTAPFPMANGYNTGPSYRHFSRAHASVAAVRDDAMIGEGPSAIEAPAPAGLLHCYLIDADDARRSSVHKILAGRKNLAVRAYKKRANFLDAAQMLDPGCVVLFGQSNDREPVAFIHRLCEEKRFSCVVLATEKDLRSAIDAMKAGATDCLLYPCPETEILASVDEALESSRKMVEEHAELIEARRQIDRLTSRETDVLHGLLEGKSNKMIAIDLDISPRTVEIYRAHLMEKLGTHSLSETLKIAFAAGMN